MAVMAPVSGLSLAALTRFSAGLPLPEAAAPSAKQPKLPDVVVFSSAPTRIMSDLASAGLRQLATLLPMLERAVQGDATVPLGQLAKAAGAAARQIGDGHEALLAEGPDRITASAPQSENAVVDAKQLLRTLVRQIGAEVEPADDNRTSESPPTTARQVLAETPVRFAVAPAELPAKSAATPETAPDPKQSLRALARQLGAEMEPADSRTSDPSRTIPRELGTADQPEARARAEPDAGPIQRWIADAKHLLRSTGDVLERAEEQLRPVAAAEPGNVTGIPPAAWVLTEILAAQAQIGLAYAAVSRARTSARVSYRAAPSTLSLDHLASATTLLGMLLVLATLWVLGGLWTAVTGVVGLGGTAIWVWRISQASKGVTLDARR